MIMKNQYQDILGLNQFLKLSAQAYKNDLMNILKDTLVIDIGRENCSHCDPQFKLIFFSRKK